MPYIEQKDREKLENLEHYASSLGDIGLKCETAGDLNYVFTVIVQAYLKSKGGRYQQINDIIGALEGCKLEFYRRIAAPYEDLKIQQNGDVIRD